MFKTRYEPGTNKYYKSIIVKTLQRSKAYRNAFRLPISVASWNTKLKHIKNRKSKNFNIVSETHQYHIFNSFYAVSDSRSDVLRGGKTKSN